MNLSDAFSKIAPQFSLDPAVLMTYADEDNIGGFHFDETQRKWTVGSIWEVEAQFIYALIRALRPARVLELGVGNGCTTTHVLTALEKNGAGELVSLDPHPYSTEHIPADLRQRWQYIPVDAVAWLENNTTQHFDVIIEDAMHSYEMTYGILAPAKRYQPRLIISHDAAHAIEGEKIRRAFVDALGSCDVYDIEPADCGLGLWVAPDSRPRILYAPIFEPGTYHDVALANKQGLRNALSAIGTVQQIDYLAIPADQLFAEMQRHIEVFKSTILFLQIGSDRITAAQLQQIKADHPALQIINWNGDVWESELTSPAMLDVLRHVDLQLVVNASVLDVYKRHGINAAFWPFGYETPIRELPEVPAYDVLYLGTNYSDKRKALEQVLTSVPGSVGIYGGGWATSQGECLYDFTMGEALYRKAGITISDNQFPDAAGYLSNRPFQAMAAGCFVLQQKVDQLEALTGLVNGIHYIEFESLDDLPALIEKWLKKGNEPRRRKIAKAGQAFVREHHSFEQRVKELLAMLERATV